MDFIEPYKITVLVLGLSGFTFLLQLAVVDIVGIKVKHIPGHTIENNHDNFFFRSYRALANSNESAAILILFTLFAILSSANATWLNASALVYLFGRISHMLFYYNNLKTLRSVAFIISLIGLLSMFVAGVSSWLYSAS